GKRGRRRGHLAVLWIARARGDRRHGRAERFVELVPAIVEILLAFLRVLDRFAGAARLGGLVVRVEQLLDCFVGRIGGAGLEPFVDANATREFGLPPLLEGGARAGVVEERRRERKLAGGDGRVIGLDRRHRRRGRLLFVVGRRRKIGAWPAIEFHAGR